LVVRARFVFLFYSHEMFFQQRQKLNYVFNLPFLFDH